MRRTSIILTSVLLLAGLSPLALADEGKDKEDDDRDDRDRARDGKGRHVSFDKEGGRWVLRNDHIAVSFHQTGSGKAKPDLVVAINGTDGNETGYRVKVNRICEVDERLHCSGKYPRMNLERSRDWNVVTERVNESLILTMVTAEAQGIVRLVWHIDTVNASVKYDVQVENWRWGNASHRLMLDMLVLGKDLRNTTGDRVNVEDSGYVAWEPTALATYADGTRTIPVEAYLKPLRHDEDGDDDEDRDEDEDERRAVTGGHVYLLFNATGGYSNLDYDPTFAVQSAGSVTPVDAVPAVGLAVGAAVVAAAAFTLRRRRG